MDTTVHGEGIDITSNGLAQEIYLHTIPVGFCRVVDFDGQPALIWHDALIQREFLIGDVEATTPFLDIFHDGAYKDQFVGIVVWHCSFIEGMDVSPQLQKTTIHHYLSKDARGEQPCSTPVQFY